MPATRHERTRGDKLEELVACAQRLFVENGFEATTIASIAKELGIATNVVYWYFESKDHLFVGAMDPLVDWVIKESVAAANRGDGNTDLEAGLIAFAERIRLGGTLIAAVHERARHSPVVAAFHEEVHTRYTDLLSQVLADRGVPATDRPVVVDALSTAVEGLAMHEASDDEVQRMIRYLVPRLAPEP